MPVVNIDSETLDLEQRIKDATKDFFPVSGRFGSIEVENIRISRPNIKTIEDELKVKTLNKNLEGSVRGTFILKDDSGNEIDRSRRVLLKFPYKTNRGTYIVGGNEQVVWHQLRQRPGVYTTTKKDSYETDISFDKGSRIKAIFIPKTDHFKIEFRNRSYNAINFARSLGIADGEISSALGSGSLVSKLFRKAGTSDKETEKLYKALFHWKKDSDLPASYDDMYAEIRQYFSDKSSFGKHGENVLQENLGLKSDTLNSDVLLGAMKRTLDLARQEIEPDNRDDFRFQYVVMPSDFILKSVQDGFERLQTRIQRYLNTKTKKGTSRQRIDQFIQPGVASQDVWNFMGKSQLSEFSEQTNPLHLASSLRKVTRFGQGGLTDHSATMDMRNLQVSEFGRIDPIETPEDKKLGLVGHLSVDSEFGDGTIKEKYYQVSNRKVRLSEDNTVKLTPLEEYDSKIAFYDLEHIQEESDDEITLKEGNVPVRHRASIIEVPSSEVDYIDFSPHSVFGLAGNLIPFGNHNDGNRMLMGANMQKQAIPLVNNQEPLVQTAVDRKKETTYEELIADNYSFTIRAESDGVVDKITDNKIVFRSDDGEIVEYDRYNYYPLNQGNYINHKLKVEEGDRVSAGDLIADGWHTKDGKLSLGTNVRVAYMPWEGFNFEDGVVVTESLSEKMQSEEVSIIEVPVKEGMIGGPGSGVRNLLREQGISPAHLEKLSEDGIVKQGEHVKAGDVLVGILRPKEESEIRGEDEALASLGLKKIHYYQDYSHRAEGFLSGEIIRTEILPGTASKESDAQALIKVYILSHRYLKVGDKVAGRHGNKGIITKIISDEAAPKTSDGKNVEMIFSPLVVPSRKNVGQLLEVNAGLLAEEDGEPYRVFNFDKKNKQEVLDGLERLGVPDGKVDLINPETGKPYENKVTMGNMYVMKLKHEVDDKIQSRSIGRGDRLYRMPVKATGEAAGEKENPQMLGEMEMRALQSHKAVHNILDSTTLKSDGVGDRKQRIDLFMALANGENIPDPLMPETVKVLGDTLKGLGLSAVPIKSGKATTLDRNMEQLFLTPLKSDDIRKWSHGEISTGGAAFRIDKASGKEVPLEGGLYDPEIFGEDEKEQRALWGHMELIEPLPNPLLSRSNYNPYAIILGLKMGDVDKIMKSDVGVIIQPGDTGLGRNEIVPLNEIERLEDEGKNFKALTGGQALKEMLSQVNVEAELANVSQQLDNATRKDRDKLYKKYKILNNLKKQGMKAEDLMMEVVPILPSYLRPRLKTPGSNVVMDSELTKLYSHVAMLNYDDKTRNVLDGYKKGQLSETDKHEVVKGLYQRVSELFVEGADKNPINKAFYSGISSSSGFDSKTKSDDRLRSLSDTLVQKSGLVRGRMLSKLQDYSGRSVITVNPNLGIDEVGLPIEMAKDIYKPFILRELIKTGRARDLDQAEEKWKEKDKDFHWALKRVSKERPVILNRAPSLHKYSIQAFNPQLTNSRSIELNPLVTTGYNADFDGDQMGVHVPISEGAVKEARELMLPSKNLINPATGGIVAPLKHEMLLGVYYLTRPVDKKGKAKSYTDVEKLREDFYNQNLSSGDYVKFDGVESTAGRHVFNSYLPKSVRDYNNQISKKHMRDIINSIIDLEGQGKAVVVLDNLKNLGFKASTLSGLSIGIGDFITSEDSTTILKKVEDRVKEHGESLPAAISTVQGELEDMTRISEILGEDNPVRMMMHSGARGGPAQIRSMSLLVGQGQDVAGELAPIPVRSSHLDGLSPEEFWSHSYDARRGLADRSLNMEGPGAITREIWNTTQDVIITETDCGDKDGMRISKHESSIVGRFLARKVVSGGRVVSKAGLLITRSLKDGLAKYDDIDYIYIRSPITCKTMRGLCQKCYGTIPGTDDIVPIGEPVGILASQAVGEPTSQMTMNTFHGGGGIKGFPRIQEILHLSKDPVDKAVLAKSSGTVEDIKIEGASRIIIINGKKHKAPLTRELIVEKGQSVNAGDQLIEGNPDPREILKYKGMRPTQEFMVDDLHNTFKATGIDLDRRHLELTVNRMTDQVVVENRGNSPWVNGDIVDKNMVDKWNAENTTFPTSISVSEGDKALGAKAAETYKDRSGNIIVRSGEKIDSDILGKLMLNQGTIKVFPKPVQYVEDAHGIVSRPFKGNENWFSQLGFQHIKSEVLPRAAVYGEVEKFEDPRSRQMSGKLLNIGEGFKSWVQETGSRFGEAVGNVGRGIVDFFL